MLELKELLEFISKLDLTKEQYDAAMGLLIEKPIEPSLELPLPAPEPAVPVEDTDMRGKVRNGDRATRSDKGKKKQVRVKDMGKIMLRDSIAYLNATRKNFELRPSELYDKWEARGIKRSSAQSWMHTFRKMLVDEHPFDFAIGKYKGTKTIVKLSGFRITKEYQKELGALMKNGYYGKLTKW